MDLVFWCPSAIPAAAMHRFICVDSLLFFCSLLWCQAMLSFILSDEGGSVKSMLGENNSGKSLFLKISRCYFPAFMPGTAVCGMKRVELIR